MKRLLYGVGINDANYYIDKRVLVNGKRKVVWYCPYYKRWNHMLERCYSPKYHEKQPTYIGCTVCEEWKYFSNFKIWMEQQEWEGRQLDKDFLFEGNKVYSPSTCMFLPSELNAFITTRGNARGIYPLGVSYSVPKKHSCLKPLIAAGSEEGKRRTLGRYSDPLLAHLCYLEHKKEKCELHMLNYTNEPLLMKGLRRIRDKIQHHIENRLELTSF